MPARKVSTSIHSLWITRIFKEKMLVWLRPTHISQKNQTYFRPPDMAFAPTCSRVMMTFIDKFGDKKFLLLEILFVFFTALPETNSPRSRKAIYWNRRLENLFGRLASLLSVETVWNPEHHIWDDRTMLESNEKICKSVKKIWEKAFAKMKSKI